MIPRVYVDTSVWGGPFDAEWAIPSQRFMEQVRAGLMIAMVSDLIAAEVTAAPQNVRELFDSIGEPHRIDVTMTTEALDLANAYIAAQVIGRKSLNDARHIATATVHRADVLASWNFKHIVNVERIHGYNSVNLRLGYPQLDIRTPPEVLHYDNE